MGVKRVVDSFRRNPREFLLRVWTYLRNYPSRELRSLVKKSSLGSS